MADKQSGSSGWLGLSSESSRTTVVLAVVLAGCLLVAQMLVLGRADQLRARENAVKLIQKVAETGLVSYLGSHPIKRYYQLISNGKIVGFGGLSLEASPDDNNRYVFKGREIRYWPETGSLVEGKFTIANDLSEYVYTETFRNQSTIDATRLSYQDGMMKGHYWRVLNWAPLGDWSVKQDNVVPKFLLDFFSSLAVREGFNDGVVLAITDIGQIPGRRSLQYTLDCWVRPGGEIPEEIKRLDYSGNGVTVKWLQIDKTQEIYYDHQDQLLWQKDRQKTDSSVEVIKSVSAQELFAEFPQARAILEDRGRDENDNEVQDI